MEEPITDINVTPLVDVSLVLVIIFMAVAPFALQAGIHVLQSKAGASSGKASISENVQITLSKDGAIKINNRPIQASELFPSVQQALNRSKDKMVIIQADEKNKVGEVVEILDVSKQAGAKKLAILKREHASSK